MQMFGCGASAAASSSPDGASDPGTTSKCSRPHATSMHAVAVPTRRMAHHRTRPRTSQLQSTAVERRGSRVIVVVVAATYDSELDRLLDRVRELLGAGDDTVLVDANA